MIGERPRKEHVFLDVVLAPSRSLGRTGFRILMVVIGGFCLAVATGFWVMGAWPVAGFMGLDVLLVYWAFRASYRSGRASESVRLDHDSLWIARSDPDGGTRSWTFHPSWLRLHHDASGTEQVQLRITSHGRTVVLGAFLPPEERDAFGRILARRLDEWRAAFACPARLG